MGRERGEEIEKRKERGENEEYEEQKKTMKSIGNSHEPNTNPTAKKTQVAKNNNARSTPAPTHS
jgi:ribose 1,5-bisphosphokinase PhnN